MLLNQNKSTAVFADGIRIRKLLDEMALLHIYNDTFTVAFCHGRALKLSMGIRIARTQVAPRVPRRHIMMFYCLDQSYPASLVSGHHWFHPIKVSQHYVLFLFRLFSDFLLGNFLGIHDRSSLSKQLIVAQALGVSKCVCVSIRINCATSK